MKSINTLFLILALGFTSIQQSNAQCNTNTSICQSGMAGPFNFNAPGAHVSTCLDFWGPGYAYIILYITQSGPLKMLIDGDASTGFLDVSVFKIPAGQSPCTAINNNANQISCNYASAASGCNQIGTAFGCPSSVPSPNVVAGDELMIVVENWSGASTNFTLQLAAPPAAQSGPGNATINPVSGIITNQSSPFQLTAVDNGGTWTGTGVSSTGMFNPATAGSGIHTITYVLGSGICQTSSTYQLTVNSSLAASMNNIAVECVNDTRIINWQTASEKNCDYFLIEKSRDGQFFEKVATVPGHGNSSTINNYSFKMETESEENYYRLVEYDLNGTGTKYGPFYSKCGVPDLNVYPNPGHNEITLEFNGFVSGQTSVEFMDQMGNSVNLINDVTGGKMQLGIDQLRNGVYTIVIKDEFKIKKTRFIKI